MSTDRYAAPHAGYKMRGENTSGEDCCRVRGTEQQRRNRIRLAQMNAANSYSLKVDRIEACTTSAHLSVAGAKPLPGCRFPVPYSSAMWIARKPGVQKLPRGRQNSRGQHIEGLQTQFHARRSARWNSRFTAASFAHADPWERCDPGFPCMPTSPSGGLIGERLPVQHPAAGAEAGHPQRLTVYQFGRKAFRQSQAVVSSVQHRDRKAAARE